MLMKVKPDGPVYEVNFTSQLITALDTVAKTPLQTDASSRTSVSGVTDCPSVTSVTCNTRPLVSSLPSVNAARGQNVVAVVSDGCHPLRSNILSTSQTQKSTLAYHYSQSLNDGRLNCNAASKAVSNARFTSGSLPDAEILENFITTGNAMHLDATGCG